MMKILSFNVKGLNDPNRLSMFHQWVLQSDGDIILVQEHKMHNRGGEIFHFKGYTCFYGGVKGEYSGVLTLIRTALNPVWITDHKSRRASIFTVDSEWGKLNIINSYASNNCSERISLWTWLQTIPLHQGIWGGDFNMVLKLQDTTSPQIVIAAAETASWDQLNAIHHLIDAWPSVNDSPGYTFHSKSHIMSWSKLDRLYFIGQNWLPSLCKMQVQVQMPMSDHFPLCMQLSDIDDEMFAQVGTARPLMVNNSLLHIHSFQNDVKLLIQTALGMHLPHMETWLYICDGMQKCIREVGK